MKRLDKETKCTAAKSGFASDGVYASADSLIMDIKFEKKGSSFRPKSVYGFLRIRYGFCSAFFEKKYNDIFGNTHYFTIGFGVNVKGVKREY